MEGGTFVYALLNRGDTAATITANWTMMEMGDYGGDRDGDGGSGGSAMVRDLWAKKDLGVMVGGVSATIGPHDVGIYKVTPQ